MLSHFNDHSLFIRAFEKSPIGMALLSCNGSFLKANPSLCRMLGYSESELINFGISFDTHPEDLETTQKLWRKLEQGEMDGFQIEKRYSHKSGTIMWGLLNVTVERNLQGIDGNDLFIAQVIDITEQKKKEEEFKKIEELHNLIAEHSQDVILRLTPDGMIVFVSPAIIKQLGYEPEELIGKYAYEYWHPDDLNNAWLRKGNSDQSDSRITVYRIRHKNGHYIWQEAHSKKIRNTAGDIQHVISMGRDITERIHSEELIRRSEKLSLVGELAAGIAHEIRNPLTSLRGFMQLYVKEDINGTKKIRNDVMISEIDRINEIVSELLVLAKPSNERYELRDVAQLLNHVTRLFEGQANLFNVQIKKELEANLPFIQCQSSINQVFINIIKNAIESMPKGGELIIQARQMNDKLHIRINDTGHGIRQEEMTKIGNPFYTTKETGTGLGLMVSMRIIQNHKGTIGIESEVGKGTMVEVILPIVNSRIL
ncbi:two-component system sporulation sensor kinase A [Paenibacillus cellulosilyticus]|uniref:histidine kinase n=1 Tax=Paenibacillus cellulosilyticus TaxID=375489 RepID=A0A2V2YTM6_9BACL|nr:PAS domain S-box protein [Paenibacillus cellulosilyticus]PWW02765.1 two-component system sporulation sensor kinase A [Paenibacillus cellulosilyticus]QKS45687.1 PAS domain S-box protein [Paenibacillus cellulosilyticus]